MDSNTLTQQIYPSSQSRLKRLIGASLFRQFLCICGVAACAVFLHYLVLNQSYSLTPAESKLLSKVAVDNGQVSFKNGVLQYNQQNQSKDGGAKLTVSGPTNSTSKQLYRVTLASKISDGIQFTDADDNLPFKLVPLTSTNNGRYIDGRMVYPSENAVGIYTLRRNGIKEDIILNQSPGASYSYSWKLELGNQLAARMLSDGGLGIYSANPLLNSSSLQVGDAKSQALIDKAKKNGKKDTLIYIIPAPYIIQSNGVKTADNVKFSLSGATLTLTADGLDNSSVHYPISIDPTVTVTTTAQFQTGYDDGNIDYSTANEIDRGNISLGKVGTWNYTHNSTNDGATFSAGFTQARYAFASVAYNGYLYMLGGANNAISGADCSNADCKGVQYAPINANGTIGAWHYTHNSTDDGTTFISGFTAHRQNLSSIAYNSYLYVIGGLDNNVSDDCTTDYCNGVQYAPINANGTIGAWHYTHNSTDDGTTFVAGFTQPRYEFASAAYNGYLYVIGGAATTANDCTANGCSGVQYAPINANGTIGAWHYTHNSTDDGTTFVAGFTQPRYEFASAAYNGYLYVIGGAATTANDCSGGYCSGVQYAPINANGTIGAWHYTHNSTDDGTTFVAGFNSARSGLASAVSSGYLYIMGGQNFSSGRDCTSVDTFCSGVQYAPINANGTIGAWHYTHNSTDDGTTFVAGFTKPRYDHVSIAYNGYLYIMGGTTDSSGGDCTTTYNAVFLCNGVQYLQINIGTPTFGTDSTWTYSSSFSQVRYAHSSVAYNGYMYVLGGLGASGNDCGTYCIGVQYAPINANGTIGTWHYTHNSTDDGTSFVSGFAQARGYFTSVAYNGYLYVIGGVAGASGQDCTAGPNPYSCSGVQYAPINANGTIGTWHYTHNSTDDGTSFVAGFAQARYGHTSVAYNGYLYVIGGLADISGEDCTTSSSGRYLCSGVQYAPINSNGTIGVWHYTHNSTDDSTNFASGFAQPRDYLSSVAYNGYLYILGGGGGSGNDCLGYCSGVQFAPINSNGTIGAWHYTHNSTDDGTTFNSGFTQGRSQATSFAYNGYLYIAGGLSSASAQDCDVNGYCSGVQFAPINSNGTIGAWHYTHNSTDDGTTFNSGFTQGRSLYSSIVYAGFLYVIGGYDGRTTAVSDCSTSGYCNGVQYTSINSPEQAATYEKVVDLGGSASIINLSFNGRAVCGMIINYRIGDSSGVYGALTTIPFGLPGTTYPINQQGRYVWVQFKMNDAVCGTRSQITDFTIVSNVIPAAPTLSAPANSATGISALPTFQLKTTDGDNDYLKYKLLLCADSGCGSVITTADQTASQTGWSGQDQQASTAYTGSAAIGSSTIAIYTYQTPLSKNTQYWWEAYAIDPGGTNTWSSASAIQTFTTGDDIPAAPELVSAFTSNVAGSFVTTFKLHAAEINSDYLRYKIDVCADSACGSIVRTIDETASQTGWSGQDQQAGTAYTGNPSIASSTIAAYAYQPPNLSTYTNYWWRAYAIDPGGSNTWSAVSPIAGFITAPNETHIQGNINIHGGVKL